MKWINLERFWGELVFGVGAELLCCRPGEQVQSPGMPWEGQLLEEAEWLGLEAKQAVASSLGLKRRLGLLGEWGLESSFVSNASRLYHTLEGSEATYLIVFSKYEGAFPIPLLTCCQKVASCEFS